ncbi:hypothetical protein G7067_03365 [Leucobacter insecticola]|uniref:Uncharacterized protein n=1 Tax=Leucobacter insecticola TaxID=2714934 RepID=A0A6G8FH24_9MICO|nr:putative Ig domain-containing protein [Leucobacter insecticola]QIM15671.1 hypothetical protein G7067_03365 [Leucobacter insecticola]
MGYAYDFNFTVTGTPAPAVTLDSGTLPAGLTLSAAGKLSGVPTDYGSYTFTVKAANGVSPDATLTITLVVNPAGTVFAPSITGTPDTATVGTTYSYAFAVTGTPAPTVTVASGTLPAGLVISASGVITGTPILQGSYDFTLNATNGISPDATLAVTLVVNPAPVAPSISGTPSAGTVGTAYDFDFTVTGTPAPTVTLDSGTLPPGLALSTAGKLSGMPTFHGSYTFTVKAANGVSPDATLTVTLVVNLLGTGTAPSITGTPDAATVGTAYSYAFAVTGTPAPTVTVASGTLPAGLVISASGVITGTPILQGSYDFTLNATNGISPDATLAVTLVVNPAPVAPSISGTPTAGTVGTAYSFDFTVTGTPAPTVILESGTMPPGLTINAAGTISGTPTTAGSYPFTVKAANGINPDATRTVTLVINTAGPVNVAPSISGTPDAATVGTAYSYGFVVAGTPAPTVTVESGNLPAGLTISNAGVISGTPLLQGSYDFTLKATNGVSPDATLAVTLVVNAAGVNPNAPQITVSLPSLSIGETQTVTGSKFPAGAVVTLELHSTPILLGTATADANGDFSFSFAIPAGTEAGTHKVVATSGNLSAEAPFTVTARNSGGDTNPGGNNSGNNGSGTAGSGSNELVATGSNELGTLTSWTIAMLLASAILLTASRRARRANNI